MKTEIKENISRLVRQARKSSSFKSNAAFARSLGLTGVDYSNIANEKWRDNPQLLSASKWAKVARAIDYNPSGTLPWKTAHTATFEYITTQLEMCQQMSTTKIMVDEAGIGKTEACTAYARRNRGTAFYILCSDCPGKTLFVKELARVLGIDQERTIEGTFKACIHFINTFLERPLLILDEFGDLEPSAILMIKRLYNATEFHLGIFACGADGLKAKMERGVRLNKNGYVEVYSRLGRNFSRLSPTRDMGRAAYRGFIRAHALDIARVNGITDQETLNRISNESEDLRQVRRKVSKILRKQALNPTR